MQKKKLNVSQEGRYIIGIIFIILGLLLLWIANNNLAMIICDILFIIIGIICIVFGRYCIELDNKGIIITMPLNKKKKTYKWSEITYISTTNIAAQKIVEKLNELEEFYNHDIDKLKEALKNVGSNLEDLQIYREIKDKKGLFIGVKNMESGEDEELQDEQIEIKINYKKIDEIYNFIIPVYEKYKK